MVQTGSGAADPIATNLSEDDVTTALRAFLLSILPAGTEVRLGQQNRVVAPLGLFVLMTIVVRQQIATNGSKYGIGTRTVSRQEHVTIQVSVFGPGAGDMIERIVTLFRDPYACQFFQQERPQGDVAPLYADDPRQTGFINGERQYENNWNADLHLQANYQYTIAQQFADAATIDLINVDAAYSESNS
ncbi:phage neck terminator protein [Acetobacter oryzoeni]|uniref:Phage neck terminator protein gp12-like domain-containing protein n=1 Tax=Acetobacter oryzoeni TaxID=2500548 RepID=A0A5B9GIF0_9PROT|nr:hypothetical protein [Acetobacter oryzoeni]MCP1202252.1 hypothetical protein [Acetobacter oryzoeni]QEE85982.1 hypothetical protein EOV40_009865 [Acetobacter oryzoeni]